MSLCVSLIRDGHSSPSQIIDPPSEILSAILIPHDSRADALPLDFYLTDLRAAGGEEKESR